MTKNNLNKLKANLTEKIQRRLSLKNPNTNYDEDLIGDYIEDAVLIIEEWAKPTQETYILNGGYNTEIIEFVIQSININGAEGASSYSDGAESISFANNPISNLKSKIPQGL